MDIFPFLGNLHLFLGGWDARMVSVVKKPWWALLSHKDRVVGPLPYMAMKMAEINGGDPKDLLTRMILQAMPPCPLRNKALLRNIEPPCLTETRSPSSKCIFFTSGVYQSHQLIFWSLKNIIWLVKPQPKDNHINKGLFYNNGFNAKLQWPLYPNAQIHSLQGTHISPPKGTWGGFLIPQIWWW